ncbi:MAG TPA: CPBP family intramembrane glutamic endopeptidase [Candidatus Tyrphobacter sp.]
MRAILVLAELWAASEIIILTGPLRGEALVYAAFAAFLVFCCGLTYLVTFPPHTPRDTPLARHLLPLQLGALLLLIALTGWTFAVRAHAIALSPPLWSSIDRHLGTWFSVVAPSDLGPALRHFTEEVLVALVVLALLRVPLAKMGLGGFARGSWSAAAIWLALPLLAVAYAILYADVSAAIVGRRLIHAFFNGGFSEEFLFRGALFGRLRSFMPTQWAAFAQALLFALWRFGDEVAHGHNLVLAFALLIPAQAAFGYAMAILVRRTGNLAVPALVHTTIAAVRELV